MANVKINYRKLSKASKCANKAATGKYGVNLHCGLEGYSEKLESDIYNPLAESKLWANDPYGRGYTDSARQCIKAKQNNLEDKSQMWKNISENIAEFEQDVKDIEKNVVSIFETTSSAYVDYSGWTGAIRAGADYLWNGITVDLANSNKYTRAICDYAKAGKDDLDYQLKQTEDYFKHGGGRYYLNIAKAWIDVGVEGASVMLAIGEIIIGVGAAELTFGASTVLVVKGVGTLANGVHLLTGVQNAVATTKGNIEAIEKEEDDPGKARFYGDISSYSDEVKRTKYHDVNEYHKDIKNASISDKTETISGQIGTVCDFATTFGTKEVIKGDKKYIQWDFSPKNIKDNALKTIGIDPKKDNKVTVEINTVSDATTIHGADNLSDYSYVESFSESNKLSDTSVALNKTIDGDTNKVLNRTIEVDRKVVKSEYSQMISSSGNITRESSAYNYYSQNSSKVYDITKALSKTSTVNNEKLAKASNLKKILTHTKNGLSTSSDMISFVQYDDDERERFIASKVVKQNYAMSKIDKYFAKYDPKKNKVYIGGKLGKEVDSIWNELVAN